MAIFLWARQPSLLWHDVFAFIMNLQTLSVLFAILMIFPGELSAQTVLEEEHFSTSEIPERWQAGGRKGSFSIVDGTLRGVAQPDDSHGPSIGIPLKGQDLTIEFDVKFAKPGYFLLLIDGDSQFKGQAHLLRFALTGKIAQLAQDRGDPGSKREQKVLRDKNGGKRVPPSKEQLADPAFYRIEKLSSQKALSADGAWHHVWIRLQGNKVEAQFDDQARMSAEGTVLNVPKSRAVFLVGQKADVRIDNVKITDQAKVGKSGK